jgi:hypothetical protein
MHYIESILSDIYEKTRGGRYLKTNSVTVPECANNTISLNLDPKSCVAMISSDMEDTVLQNTCCYVWHKHKGCCFYRIILITA